MKIKIPLLYLIVASICIVFLVFMAMWAMGLISFESFFLHFVVFVIQWVVIMMFALLGAILLGMFISIRLLATRSFTPFERSMLEMRSEIRSMRSEVSRIRSMMEELCGEDRMDR